MQQHAKFAGHDVTSMTNQARFCHLLCILERLSALNVLSATKKTNVVLARSAGTAVQKLQILSATFSNSVNAVSNK